MTGEQVERALVHAAEALRGDAATGRGPRLGVAEALGRESVAREECLELSTAGLENVSARAHRRLCGVRRLLGDVAGGGALEERKLAAKLLEAGAARLGGGAVGRGAVDGRQGGKEEEDEEKRRRRRAVDCRRHDDLLYFAACFLLFAFNFLLFAVCFGGVMVARGRWEDAQIRDCVALWRESMLLLLTS